MARKQNTSVNETSVNETTVNENSVEETALTFSPEQTHMADYVASELKHAHSLVDYLPVINEHVRPMNMQHVETLRIAFENGNDINTQFKVCETSKGTFVLSGNHRLAALRQLNPEIKLRVKVVKVLSASDVITVDTSFLRTQPVA